MPKWWRINSDGDELRFDVGFDFIAFQQREVRRRGRAHIGFEADVADLLERVPGFMGMEGPAALGANQYFGFLDRIWRNE